MTSRELGIRLERDPRMTAARQLPALWEIEWKVVEIACEQLQLDIAEVTPQSRVIEDLHLDSLDAVEFIMELEDEFEVTLSSEDCQSWFVKQPCTLQTVTELVVHKWGTGRSDRSGWRANRPPSSKPCCLPATQLGGMCSRKEWLEGQLYQVIGQNRQGMRQYRRLTDGMRCVLIPGDEVTLGNPNATAPADQRPAHQVQLNEFLLDAEPVSNLAYCRFLNSVDVTMDVLLEWCGVQPGDKRTEHLQIRRRGLFSRNWAPIRGTEQLPMMLVSWYGANAYSLWANRQDWRAYAGDRGTASKLANHSGSHGRPPRPEFMSTCLPCEAQWEYAARGAFPHENTQGDEPFDAGQACFGRHRVGSSYSPESIPSAAVNAEFGMSPFGMHHMAGNVWQWCRDWYSPDFYASAEARLPNSQNVKPGLVRSERGGSWVGPEELCRPYYRRGRPPSARGRCLGFRCMGSVEDLP